MSNILSAPGNILCRRQHCTSCPDNETHAVVNDNGTVTKDAPGCPPVIITDLTPIPVPPVVAEHLRAYSETDSVGHVVTFRFMGNKSRLPRKATSGSAGYDLYSGEDAVVPASNVRVVDTHVSVAIPLDCYGRVAPRSSLAYRLIDVGGGVIDSGTI